MAAPLKDSRPPGGQVSAWGPRALWGQHLVLSLPHCSPPSSLLSPLPPSSSPAVAPPHLAASPWQTEKLELQLTLAFVLPVSTTATAIEATCHAIQHRHPSPSTATGKQWQSPPSFSPVLRKGSWGMVPGTRRNEWTGVDRHDNWKKELL